jgi:hypothetical protein
MDKKERKLSDKDHRNQFLEAAVVNFLLLHTFEQNHKSASGNLIRGVQNAKAIAATTIDKLTTDYPDLRGSADVMLSILGVDLEKEMGKLEAENGETEKGN